MWLTPYTMVLSQKVMWFISLHSTDTTVYGLLLKMYNNFRASKKPTQNYEKMGTVI